MAQPAARSARPLEAFLLVVILSAALLLRVVNLDADPSALISRDFITDEGQWAHNVRNELAYGQWRIDDYNPAPYSAYLYHQLLRFALSTIGLSLAAVRIVSALFGWLTVVLLFFWVRRETNRRTAIFAALLLGFSNLHVLYSRTGFVESTMVFFLALTLWLWSIREKHSAFALSAGVAFGLMLLTKVTAIYVVPGVVLLAAAEPVRHTTSKRDAMLFLCGATLVGAGYAAGFVAPNFTDWINYNLAAGLDNEFPRHPSDLVSGVLRLLVWRYYARTPILTALTLVALGGLIIRICASGLKGAIRRTGNIEITGIALLVGYLLSVGLTVYQPERRFIPALFLMVPLSANVLDKGWSWFEALGRERIKLRAGAWFVMLFSLPAVAIIELKWATLGSPLSLRFWLLRAIPVVVLTLISAVLGRRRLTSRMKLRLLTGSRLIFVSLFCALSVVLVYQSLTLWGLTWSARFVVSAVLILASVIAIVVALKIKLQAAVIIAAFVSIEAVQVSTWLLQRTYTLKQANETLAGVIKEGQTVVTHYETLLLSSGARTVCYWPKAGFNVDAFERFNPDYILILRRDNWKDYALGDMPSDEWPPPTSATPTRVARFDLCPTRARGFRFSLELYRLVRNDLALSTFAGCSNGDGISSRTGGPAGG
jgi:4-amino-4-deoxy-L-arabinose transferase-like glycosyltransferase